MTSKFVILTSSVALTALMSLPARAAGLLLTDFSAPAVTLSAPALAGTAEDAQIFLVDDDDEHGRVIGGLLRWLGDDDDDDDDGGCGHDDDDDDDDHGSGGYAGGCQSGAAQVGNAPPPDNGLFMSGSTPTVSTN
jgi:hypothetical protein